MAGAFCMCPPAVDIGGLEAFPAEVPTAPRDLEPVAHVFDQTNGVLGEDVDESDEPDGDPGSPKFGIPPIVSL